MSDVCDSDILHEGAVARAQTVLSEQSRLEDLSDFFKVLGDPTRLKILLALRSGELCVCDLSATVGLSVSAISHQLAGLRRARLVAGRRDGKVVYYRLDDEHVEAVLDLARIHVDER